MRYIKAGEKVNVKLTLPKNLQWRIGGSFLNDLFDTKSEFCEASSVKSENFRNAMYRATEAYRLNDLKRLTEVVSDSAPQRIMQDLDKNLSYKGQAYEFFCRYQAGSLLKKFPFKGTNCDVKAVDDFMAFERHVGLYNAENYKALLALDQKHPLYYGIIDEVKSDIEKVLGSTPPLELIYDLAQHGPGVTNDGSHSLGIKTTEYFKYSELPYTVTHSCLPYAREVILRDPRWIGALDDAYRNSIGNLYRPIDLDDFWKFVFEVIDYNKIATVPKTYLTDRTIAVEPRLNVFVQLGVDRVIRRRLKKCWGYDLDDQELNQKLAYEASLSEFADPAEELSTLDLKGASDTTALRACEILIPPAWYGLLLDLRCSRGQMRFQERNISINYEKLSSMGNGYTFAVESLIFGALVRVAIRRTKSIKKSGVYGDDLICPRTAAPLLIDLLQLFGFMVNVDKTFISGPFRESCGKDFYLGTDVRPLFFTRELQSIPDLIYCYNAIFALQQRLPWLWGVNFDRTLNLILKYIPKNIREQFWGPVSESLDTHIFVVGKTPRFTYKGYKIYYKLVPRPKKFNRLGSSFFFRKLMNQLKGLRPAEKWFRREYERMSSGNAFDITMRGVVRYHCTRSQQY